jgi:hypothetical protein
MNETIAEGIFYLGTYLTTKYVIRCATDKVIDRSWDLTKYVAKTCYVKLKNKIRTRGPFGSRAPPTSRSEILHGETEFEFELVETSTFQNINVC